MRISLSWCIRVTTTDSNPVKRLEPNPETPNTDSPLIFNIALVVWGLPIHSGLPDTTEYTIWVIKKTFYGLKDSIRVFCNLLKKTILSFTSTEKIIFQVGTTEQCSFISKDTTGKTVTYIVGYVDDLIVADRSNQKHVSKQIMEEKRKKILGDSDFG